AETGAARAEVERRQSAVEEARSAVEVERGKLRTLLGHLPVAVWVVDAGGMILGVNREAERLQGFGIESGLGQVSILEPRPEYRFFRPDGCSYRPDELPLARALLGEVVTQEEMVWPFRGEGEQRIVSVNAAPLTDPAGAIAGAVAVVQDVTARKRAG